jgi:hypothetical protein
MTEPITADAAPIPARLSPVDRMVRIFVRPKDAWEGLEERGQWLFPFVLGLALVMAFHAAAFDRVTLPFILNQWSEAVANGQMPATQEAQMTHLFTETPWGVWIVIGQQAIFWLIFTFLQALLIWFGTGFVLGTKMRYRHSLEVLCWSGLVKIPALALFLVLALARESFTGVHLGLGVLLPEPETPSKLITGLQIFLDLLGPFEAWWVAVAVIGASALSGAPRRNVAWVLVAIYLAFGAFMAAVSAYFTPGA